MYSNLIISIIKVYFVNKETKVYAQKIKVDSLNIKFDFFHNKIYILY